MATETLTEVMTSTLQKAGQKTQQTELQETSKKKVTTITGCPDRKTFLVKYNPDTQIKVSSKREHYITAAHPTLNELNQAYGERTATVWLMAQIVDLSEFAGTTTKLSGKPLEQCARILAAEHGNLSIYDMMLFFYDFKAGKMGRFYGAVDALTITEGVWKFKEYKRNELARIEMQRPPTQNNEGGTTWEDYCMRKFGKIKPLGGKP